MIVPMERHVKFIIFPVAWAFIIHHLICSLIKKTFSSTFFTFLSVLEVTLSVSNYSSTAVFGYFAAQFLGRTIALMLLHFQYLAG